MESDKENLADEGKENPENLARRREQDLECLTLLREAMLLQKDREYVDAMFASLKGSDDKAIL